MARKPPRSKRLEFFRLGNTHCPICLVPFTEESAKSGHGVTLEHAPPKTLGGHATCLTCETCNQRASATSDQAAKRSKGPPRLQLDINGIKREARFWPDGIPPAKMPYRFAESPAAQAAKRELDGETVVAATAPMQFGGPTTIKEIVTSLMTPDPRHVEIGYLRSAYLLVFSLLGRGGYVWARSEAIRQVREQILNPDKVMEHSLLRAFASERPPGNVITLRKNETPFFWSVRFDDGACVFLPHGGSGKHYQQVAELPEQLAIQGWEWNPAKFGSTALDRRPLIRTSGFGRNRLFGTEYVTVWGDGSKQRWVVVNDDGDAAPAGPMIRPGAEASATPSTPKQATGS